MCSSRSRRTDVACSHDPTPDRRRGPLSVEDPIEVNRAGWNLRTAIHLESDFYNLKGWKAGQCSLQAIEKQEVGDVQGLDLLHLQCHFGLDTLSWARRGARVIGCDLSDAAIAAATELAQETALPARFFRCNLFDLPDHLDDTFDIVFTSYGVLGWLPDLAPWGQLIARYLKPGGFFYMVEFHPIVWMFDDTFEGIQYAYHNSGPILTENSGSYTDRGADVHYRDYGWNHSLSEIVNSLLRAGLSLEFLNEFPYSPYPNLPRSIRGDDGHYRIEGLEEKFPLLFSLKARAR